MLNLLVLLAQENPPANTSPGAALSQFMPIIFLVVLGYLFLWRPMRRQEKERQALLSSLKAGDEVVTNSGIVGTVLNVSEKEDRMTLKTGDNTRLRMLKSVVARNLTNEEAAKAPKSSDAVTTKS